ncbi:hypothetical protein Dimus_033861 [Dionaea muscipula]
MTDRDSLPLHHCSRRGLQAEPTKRGQRPATLEPATNRSCSFDQGDDRGEIGKEKRESTCSDEIRHESADEILVRGFTPVRERTCASEGEIGRIQGRRWPAPIRVFIPLIDEIVPLNDPSGAYETIEFNEIIPDEDDETASISQSIDEEEEGEDDFEDTTQDSVESYDDDK